MTAHLLHAVTLAGTGLVVGIVALALLLLRKLVIEFLSNTRRRK
jgi:hypothetical protein